MKCCILAGLALVITATPEAYAQQSYDVTSSSPLVLSIDKGTLGSEDIRRGDYRLAIDLILRRNDVDSDLSAQHALCVSYIALNDLEKAEGSCQTALQLASSVITTARNPYGHKNRPGLEKAQSNYAVLEMLRNRQLAANSVASNSQSTEVADNHLSKNQTTDR